MESTDFGNRLALRPREAAKVIGISMRALWQWTTPRGPIPCIRVGNGKRQAVLYPVDALQAWLRQQQGNAGQ